MQIENYATITAKVFEPGTHNGADFPPERVEAMVNAANACVDYITGTIELGTYPNNDIPMTKPIPGWINLNHQGFLTETFRNAVKGIVPEFLKDGEWIVAKFRNVKDEIADFLKAGFPFRSIELIPELFNPNDGKTYKDVIRSVGFLTANPAVPQEPGYAVEYAQEAEDSFVLLYSQAEDVPESKPLITEGERQMAKEETQPIETPEEAVKAPAQGVPVEEYESLKAEQANQQAAIQEMKAALAMQEAEKSKIQESLKLEREKRETQDIKMFCDALEHDGQASPAFIELISPHLAFADNGDILEFGEDKKATQRQALQDLFSGIVEMAQKHAITVTLQNPLKFNQDDPMKPDEKPEDVQDRLVAEFAADAKARATNPNDQKEVYQLALKLAIDAYPDKF